MLLLPEVDLSDLLLLNKYQRLYPKKKVQLKMATKLRNKNLKLERVKPSDAKFVCKAWQRMRKRHLIAAATASALSVSKNGPSTRTSVQCAERSSARSISLLRVGKLWRAYRPSRLKTSTQMKNSLVKIVTWSTLQDSSTS